MTKVLVAFASRHGATAELAQAIGGSLASHGLEVDIRPMGDVDTVYPYDAYVLGGAIYIGAWLTEAREFLSWHRELIRRRPTWLFSSGPIADPDAPGIEPFDPSGLLAETHARDHELFGGRLDRDALNVGERLLSRAVRVPNGDFRDWAAVNAWAESIAGSLSVDVPA